MQRTASCPRPPTFLHTPLSEPLIPFTTSPTFVAHFPPSPSESTSPPTRLLLQIRENHTGQLLGAELGGTLGGATFLLLLVIAFIFMRRRRARQLEDRLPQRQEPFIVNPTWVLGSPTTPEGARSQLSLPDRARPRTVPVTHQMSMPDLSTQYRSRVLRPRADTVGSILGRTETRESQDQSESGVWRPRIDIFAARQQRMEGAGPSQPQTPMDSFWVQ
ncbi:hypothetical protein K438DRAFT_1981143 [Mycena galopus ATCC 62051]|nr:hypothetical protein K438DRAFT_1981143 [Mycena galopus ATCC 62051]